MSSTLNGLISEVIKTFILEVPTVIFLLGVALYRKWDLTLMSLILLPLLAYSTSKFGKGVKEKEEGSPEKTFLSDTQDQRKYPRSKDNKGLQPRRHDGGKIQERQPEILQGTAEGYPAEGVYQACH